MKKHIITIAIILLTSLLFSVSTISKATVVNQPKVTENTAEKYYILTEYGGRIALFEENNSIPLEVFDVLVSSMPENDIKAISDGIRVSYEEIPYLIEEYLS